MKQGMTLTGIAEELERQAKSKRDFIAPSRDIRIAPVDGDFQMGLIGVGKFGVTDICHEQIGQRLGIPKTYYERMRSEDPELLATNVNRWLSDDKEPRMVRTLDGNARSLLSNRYRPLDNPDLAEAVLPVIQEAGCHVESAALTERRLYIKAVTERVSVEVRKGDVVQAGIVVSNSEVGMGGVKVEPMIFRLACMNGMIAPDYGLKKYHIGRGFGGDESGAEELYRDETRQADDKAFWMKVRDIVKGSLQRDVFERIARKMTQAASEEMAGDPVKVVEVAQKRFGLSEDERGGVLKHLIKGGDLTKWGLLNAVTRTSQDVKDYDRATELERLGGQILELPKTDWESLGGAR